MVDRDVFDRRFSRLEELLRELRRLSELSRPEYLTDPRARAASERWLQLAVECCLDLAHHLIADRGWKVPETYRDAFVILAREGAISEETSRRLQGWAGLRNVLVHLYMDVDHERLYDALTGELGDLETFAREIRRSAQDAG